MRISPRPTPIRSAALIGALVLLAGCDQTHDASAVAAPRHPTPSTSRASASKDKDGESGYYNGRVYSWSFPSGSSNNQNQLIVDCFHLGVDITSRTPSNVGRLYAVFLDGAHQHSCPDGTILHDHILSSVPGAPEYTTVWDLMEAWPGPNFDPGIMPITSEEALLAAVGAGQVVLIDDQLLLHAVVTGPAQP